MKTAIALLTPLALACRMVAAQAVYEESAPVVAYRHPPGRGSSFELAERAPCGGWALGGRTEYPLSGGQVAIELGRDANGLQFAYSTDNDVSASSTFTNIGQSFSLALSGSRCLSVSFISGRSDNERALILSVCLTGAGLCCRWTQRWTKHHFAAVLDSRTQP